MKEKEFDSVSDSESTNVDPTDPRQTAFVSGGIMGGTMGAALGSAGGPVGLVVGALAVAFAGRAGG